MRRTFLTRSLFPTSLVILAATSPALAQGGGGSSYFEMFFTSDDIIGQAIIILLVLLSVVSIGLTIKFALQFRRSNLVPGDSEEEMQALLSEKKFRDAIEYAKNDESYLGQVTSAALNEASNGHPAMERAIEEEGDAQTTKMLRPLEYLNVLGQVSPMLGLFGTVYGMIVAFQRLVEAGGADPQELAAGISTALVTTLWGLIVAIPALAAYSVIRNRVDAFTSDGMFVAEELVSVFKPSRKSGKASSGSGSGKSGGSGGGDGPGGSKGGKGSGGSDGGGGEGPSGGSARPRATPKPE